MAVGNSKERPKLAFLYTLSDPITGRVRYVGSTFDITRRWNQHIRMARTYGENKGKTRWIQSLIAAGLWPQLRIETTVTVTKIFSRDAEHLALERDLIQRLTDSGEDLLNVTKQKDGWK